MVASTTAGEVDRLELGRLLAQDPQAGQDRVDHRVEPVHLAEGLAPPSAAAASAPPARAAVPISSRLARTTASGVRSSWVTIVTRLARASSIARRLSSWASASAWRRPFSTIPLRRAASVSRKRTSPRRKTRRRTVWTLSTPTTSSSQIIGTEHIEVSRGSSRPWSQAKRRSRRTFTLTTGRRVCGDLAGDPDAHRQAGHADLLAIEAVGGGQGHPRAVAVDEVDRADLGVDRRRGPVDDRRASARPRSGWTWPGGPPPRGRSARGSGGRSARRRSCAPLDGRGAGGAGQRAAAPGGRRDEASERALGRNPAAARTLPVRDRHGPRARLR